MSLTVRILHCTHPQGATSVVLGLSLANKTTNAVTVQCQFTDVSDSNATRQLLENVSIPANTTLEVFSWSKIYFGNRRYFEIAM